MASFCPLAFAAEAGLVTVDALEGVQLLPAVGTEPDGSRAVDPHVWLDPMRYADAVARIGLALGEAKPSGATTFRANAGALRDELSVLDDEFRRGLPIAARVMITNHASFGYLADAYDLEQQAISGVAPGIRARPGPHRGAP
jgi:zinc transport system substrate-binding protein